MAKKDKNNIITVADMAPHVHSFLVNENKVDKLTKWLMDWIELSLECGKIKPYDFLPPKGDLACHIGVSQGTMQNVYRRLEDEGLIESKQRIGTYIKPKASKIKIEKLTSKREFIIELIKRYIVDNQYQIGEKLESSRKLAKIFGVSNSTITTALANLVQKNILNKHLKSFYVANLDYSVTKIYTKTLAEKVSEKIKDYVLENLKEGDRLPVNIELKKRFKTSAKTVHDAIKILTKEGFLHTRRGQYGTIYVGENQTIREYDYERIETKIRAYIASNCQVGDKLPPITELAKNYNTSGKTIKKALDELSDDGFVAFSRGRYGGTFVTDIPHNSQEAYKWLAISSDYVSDN